MFKFETIKSLLRDTNVSNSDDDYYFNRLRKKEFSRLDKDGHIYLDYTGGCLYPESLIQKHESFLRNGIYGNPHSKNPASQLSGELVEETRKKILDFFRAGDYYCVFTNNASGALQIVGESFSFGPSSVLLLTADNHNSVNGIREYCKKKGGVYYYSPMNYEDLRLNEAALEKNLTSFEHVENKLFAFPAQSNVSGVRHSLSWIKKAHEKGWDVLLDAAAFVPTSRLDLSIHKPEFVSMSFYKMFGYPTGIGCLLVRKDKFQKLRKPAYAGGTITLSSAGYDSYFLKQDHEKFENGTVNYLGIPAVLNGLEFIEDISIEKINRRTQELSSLFIAELQKLRHDNEQPLLKLYGPTNTEQRGGTFLLNFFDLNGEKYPFEMVEQLANHQLISFRTGCFCNPGIDELNHCISAQVLKDYFTSRDHGDYYDFINFTKKMRGAVRVSIGIATTREDLRKFYSFVKRFLNMRVTEFDKQRSANLKKSTVSFLYPLKARLQFR